MGERNISSPELQQELYSKQKEATDEAKKVMARKMSWVEQTAKGDLGHVQDQFSAVYQVKAEELTRELLSLQEQLAGPHILRIQELMLSSLRSRASLSMEVMNSPEAKDDLYAQTSRGISFLQSASIPSLLYEHLVNHNHPEAAAVYLKKVEERGLQIVPDYFPVVEKIQKNSLQEKDWQTILDQTSIFGEGKEDFIEKGVAMSLLSILNEGQKMILIDKVLDRPNASQILETMTVSGYVQVLQVSQVIQKKLANPKIPFESRVTLQSISMHIEGKEVAQAQEQVEVARVREVKRRLRGGRRIGETNVARNLLTFRGLGGTILALNGMATVAANVLMNLHQPSQLLSNKALAIGLGMTGIGLEVSNGMGGLVDKPSTNVAQVADSIDSTAKGRDKRRDAEQLMYRESFEKDIVRSPKARAVYLQFTKEINAAYQRESSRTHHAKVNLSFETIGLNWQKLEKQFEPIDKADTEKTISEWVSRMGNQRSSDFKAGPGEFDNHTSSQETFMTTEIEKKYHLDSFEFWSPERKQEFLLEAPKSEMPEAKEPQK